MKDFLGKSSALYYQAICNGKEFDNLQVVIIIHILSDIQPFLEALAPIVDIPLIVAVPYSIHIPTLHQLNRQYEIITPSLESIQDKNYLLNEITNHIDPQKKVLVLEIGGYCAPILKELKTRCKNFLGIIEDTEAGHRRYKKLDDEGSLACPVISVARSPLKNPENFMVGATCLHVTEKIIRETGYPIQGKHSLVLGFGQVGRGMAYALRQYHSPVYVYDIDPIKNIQALSEGFLAVEKEKALRNVEIIYGTTGHCSMTKDEFPLLNDSVILVSCSSKQIEFDVTSLKSLYKEEVLSEYMSRYEANGKRIYLLAEGKPVNFINGAVTLGPLLNLPLAEMLFSIKKLATTNYPLKLIENSFEERQIIAAKWLDYFRDVKTGRYRYE